MTDNPLLERAPLPAFDRLGPEHVGPAIDRLLADYRDALDELGADPDPTWDGFVVHEERLVEAIDRAFSPVSQLHAVSDDPAWRAAYAENVARLSAFYSELGQDRRRFRAYRAIRDGEGWASLDAARRKIVEDELRDFRLSGIDLPEAEQARYRAIMQELTELATRFQQQLQDATDRWQLVFPDAAPLAGLPAAELAAARARADERDLEGYAVTLEMPSYQAVMTYADDRALREQVYRAYATRASDQGEDASLDNGPVIHRILTLRAELAALLGFDDYAGLSLARKMADSPAQVAAFLRGLAERARPRAVSELDALETFAREQGGATPLAPWDVPYWSEKLRKARFAISDEELRPYFPAERCLEGLFAVASELFEVRIEARGDVATWHPTARYFEVLDGAGQPVAGFYVDLFARKGKRGGAWMGDCRSRYRRGDELQLPIAFLNCNFPPPTGEGPSLLNHDELTTLFHEFGHALHHMLTRIDHPPIAGIHGVEWDAVELPSQFLENWCWQREALDRFARHHETDEPLPADLFARMHAARTFQSGLFLVRQLEFALTDLALHTAFDPTDAESHLRLLDAVRDEVAVLKPPTWNRFLNGFGHLFAGGYAAGYYSYLWAEQLAADAFARFEEEGVFSRELGRSFRREILEVGGSRPANESFVAFRGRDPDLGPLLRRYGIDAEAA